ncbi:MAG: DUF6379 domain-containing protein [Bacillus subtilis]|nr:DUF6379 domain-containing protein [Bacillus subtilis]
MFERYLFRKNSCVNVVKDNHVVGYELRTFISYYRSVPLSMIHLIDIVIDGIKANQENIRFSPDQKVWFTLQEMKTVATYKWEYGDEATIQVTQDQGLSKGPHRVKLEIAIRTPYVPAPFGGAVVRDIIIE